MSETLITGASGEIGTLLGEKYPGAVLIGRRKINHKKLPRALFNICRKNLYF